MGRQVRLVRVRIHSGDCLDGDSSSSSRRYESALHDGGICFIRIESHDHFYLKQQPREIPCLSSLLKDPDPSIGIFCTPLGRSHRPHERQVGDDVEGPMVFLRALAQIAQFEVCVLLIVVDRILARALLRYRDGHMGE